MACQENNCKSLWTSLCNHVGQACQEAETVFSSLIRNDDWNRQKIAPKFNAAIGFADNQPVFWDLTNDELTTGYGIPVGVHIHAGHVQPYRQIYNINVQTNMSGDLPVAGTFLDATGTETADTNRIAYIALEEAETLTACIRVMAVETKRCRDMFSSYVMQAGTTNESIVVPLGSAVSLPLDPNGIDGMDGTVTFTEQREAFDLVFDGVAFNSSATNGDVLIHLKINGSSNRSISIPFDHIQYMPHAEIVLSSRTYSVGDQISIEVENRMNQDVEFGFVQLTIRQHDLNNRCLDGVRL